MHRGIRLNVDGVGRGVVGELAGMVVVEGGVFRGGRSMLQIRWG